MMLLHAFLRLNAVRCFFIDHTSLFLECLLSNCCYICSTLAMIEILKEYLPPACPFHLFLIFYILQFCNFLWFFTTGENHMKAVRLPIALSVLLLSAQTHTFEMCYFVVGPKLLAHSSCWFSLLEGFFSPLLRWVTLLLWPITRISGRVYYI